MRPLLLVPLLALCTSGCVGAVVRAQAQARMPDPVQMLRRADTDGDGVITLVEFMEARGKLFGRLDRNGDGFLTSADVQRRRRLRSGGGGDRLAEATRGLDKDGDGRISRDEFVNTPGLIFDRADANHDGRVDRQELEAFEASAAARRGRQG